MKLEDRVFIRNLNELTDLSVLQKKIIFSDDFETLSKERQTEIYKYCKIHANFEACRENLSQIRYAVA